MSLVYETTGEIYKFGEKVRITMSDEQITKQNFIDLEML